MGGGFGSPGDSGGIGRDEPVLDETTLRQIYDSVNDAIFVHDAASGAIVDVNETMCEMYGYSKADARELSIGDLSAGEPPYTQETALKHIQKARDGEPQVFDWRAKHRDGSLFWVEVSMRRTTVDDRTLVIVIVRDITDRKEREAELSRRNERLEEFASVISHDLRNPLRVASGRVELASAECDSDHLDVVRKSHDRMEALIDDLLALARQGTTETEPEFVDIETVVDDCWATVETAAARLTTDVDRTVSADSTRLKQLFENLIANSVEHAGDTVEIRVGELDDGFYVEDDGPGIPEDARADVFTPGYSTDSEGTGLGLTIVRDVADEHGWAVRITDGDTGGARFEITGVEFRE
ncbi:MAG: PAS domain-containing sensor histidine kinase [Natronomonas sp.]